MTRTTVGRPPFGLRVTPGRIQDCFSFLRRAARFVREGRPSAEYGPCAPRRVAGKTAGPRRR